MYSTLVLGHSPPPLDMYPPDTYPKDIYPLDTYPGHLPPRADNFVVINIFFKPYPLHYFSLT